MYRDRVSLGADQREAIERRDSFVAPNLVLQFCGQRRWLGSQHRYGQVIGRKESQEFQQGPSRRVLAGGRLNGNLPGLGNACWIVADLPVEHAWAAVLE